MDREPRVEKGSASSMAFAFDDTRHRHASLTVYADGSGHLAIYNSATSRLLAEVSFRDYEHFRALRDAIDSQAQSADQIRIAKSIEQRWAKKEAK